MDNVTEEEMKRYPGGDLVWKGLQDLALGHESLEALLVLVGAPRLRGIGFDVPLDKNRSQGFAEDRLYAQLQQIHDDDAHSQYNALIRRLVSFENACDCLKNA